MDKTILASLLILVQVFVFGQTNNFRSDMLKITSARRADIGVAVSSPESNKDSLYVNGHRLYPMMSVVKLHTALAVLHQVDLKKLDLNHKV